MDRSYAAFLAELLLDEDAPASFLLEGVLGTVALDTSAVDLSKFTFGFEVEFLFSGGGSSDSESADSRSVSDLDTSSFESYFQYNSRSYNNAVAELRDAWYESNTDDYRVKAEEQWRAEHVDDEDVDDDDKADSIAEIARSLAEDDLPDADSLISEKGWYSFISDIDAEPIYGYSDDGDYYIEEKTENGLDNVGEAMRNDLGIRPIVFHEAHEETKDLDRWYVEPDGSVEADDSDDTEAEIGSPVFQDFETGMAQLKRVLEWVGKRGYTNESTGLHIGIGFKTDKNASVFDQNQAKAQSKEIDLLKLVILLGEKHIGNAFSRYNNTYAESHIQKWLMRSEAELKTLLNVAKGEGDSEQRKKDMLNLVSTHKYRTVNIGKFVRNNYFEFRIMGGKDYHKKLKEVDAFCRRYAAAIQGALDPTAYRKEYLQQVARMVLGTKAMGDMSFLEKRMSHFTDLVWPQGLMWNSHKFMGEHTSRKAVANIGVLNNLAANYSKVSPEEQVELAKLMRVIVKRHAKQDGYSYEDFLESPKMNGMVALRELIHGPYSPKAAEPVQGRAGEPVAA